MLSFSVVDSHFPVSVQYMDLHTLITEVYNFFVFLPPVANFPLYYFLLSVWILLILNHIEIWFSTDFPLLKYH